jgi:hypothetical protein
MYGNPAEDWRALTEHYRSMSDEQLCELAIDFGDLTQTAQQVLRDEMKLRKLGDPQAADWSGRVDVPQGSVDLDESEAPRGVEYTWKTPLCQCDSREEAWQIAEVLRRAGIESWIEGPQTYARSSGSDDASFNVGSQRVLVAADQLDEARLIASRPIPPEVIEQSRMSVPEYEVPVCPRCGAEDPLLESVDPVNVWSCEACGAEWIEQGPEQSHTR